MAPVSNQRAVNYLVWLAAAALAWAAFCITFTILVDPYRMYGTPDLTGWNVFKPRVYQESGIAKTNQIERIVPKTLLLGNSRVEIGFDPNSAIWPDASKPIFNAARAGTGLRTALAMLREDIAVHPPRAVYLGLDFQDFLGRQSTATTPLPPIDPDEQRLLVTRRGDKNAARPWQIWRDRFATTLTFDALTDSVLTILDQDPKTTVTMTRLGFNPLREYTLFARRTGYYGLFLAKAKEYQQQYSRYEMPNFSNVNNLANFRDLASIVALARKHGVELVFFTQPYHADYLEMLHQRGLWSSFEQWKRAMVQFASAANVPFYDFADYNSFTTEQVPDRGDTIGEMRWYWEPGHYKQSLGDEMLQVMIKGSMSFGRRLTPANVEAEIWDIREERKAYLPREDNIARQLWGEKGRAVFRSSDD